MEKDTKVVGADAETTEAFTGRVWKDHENAWFCGVPIKVWTLTVLNLLEMDTTIVTSTRCTGFST